MKLDITVCHSILKYCLSNIISGNKKAVSIWNEIHQNRIVLNEDLIVHYELEFENNNEFFDNYQQWIANITVKTDSNYFLGNDISNSTIDALFESDDYLKILVNLAYSTSDKIIFSEILSNNKTQLENLKILPMNMNRVLDKKEDNCYNSPHTVKFIDVLLNGIKELLEEGEKEKCIRDLKKGQKNESQWRDWFSEYIQNFEYNVLAEPNQGKKILDLIVKDKDNRREYKMEFKLWYNKNYKGGVIKQINNYLTDFNKNGFIFMINDSMNDIDNEYEEFINNNIDKQNSNIKFEKIISKNNEHDYSYYKSKHKFGVKEKIIYHFIINPFPKIMS